MNKKWMLSFLPYSLLLFSTSTFANHYDLSVGGGAAFSDLSNQDSPIVLSSFVTNRYDTDKNFQANLLAELGVGYTWENLFHYPLNIGINVSGYYVNFNDINGTEFPMVNLGNFDTLQYQFSAQSFAAMLESHFYFTRYTWQPFIFVGIGVSWNHLYDYDETPTNPRDSAASLPVGFESNTETSFAYEGGIGIQRLFFEDKKNNIQWLLALDYRYMNLGKGELGLIPTQTSSNTLEIDHLTNQAIVFTVTAAI